jgi:hypothetical protein
LVYAYESGAINEALSDIWGETYDLINNTAADTAANRWQIGEDIPVYGPLRNMKNPTLFGDPDSVGSPKYWLKYGDEGGVHINSGIVNKAAYLMVDGDTFNSYTVTGIGIDKMLAVFYRAQVALLTQTSDFQDLYDTMLQACSDVTGGAEGVTVSDCQQVENALLATGMNLPSPLLPVTTELCEAGVPYFGLYEDFEGNTSYAFSGSGIWGIIGLKPGVPLDGSRSAIAENPAYLRRNALTMNFSLWLPTHSPVYLHFWHDYDFEPGGWDGGTVEYSLNGGAKWKQLKNDRLVGGEGYIDKLISSLFNDNPLAGKWAYGNSSFGTAMERYDLSDFAGESFQLRFSVGTNSVGGGRGWTVDNIALYTCYEGPAPTAPQDLGVSYALDGPTLTWGNPINPDDFTTLLRSDGITTVDVTIIDPGSTSYFEPWASCGTTYTYSLHQENPLGTDISNEVTVGAPVCPIAPNDLAAEWIDDDVHLAWTNTADGNDIVQVIRTGGSIPAVYPEADLNLTNFIDTQADCDVVYSYTINVRDEGGSVMSNTAAVPASPCGSEYVQAGSFDTLSWTMRWRHISGKIYPERECGVEFHNCVIALKPGSAFKQGIGKAGMVPGGRVMLSTYYSTSKVNIPAQLVATLKYLDGGKEKLKVSTGVGTQEFQWGKAFSTVVSPLKSVTVQVSYSGIKGKAWFDGISVRYVPAPAPRGGDVLPLPAAPDGFRGNN